MGPLTFEHLLDGVGSDGAVDLLLFVVFFLLRPRTRPLAYAAVVVFHAVTALLFPIGIFPWLMIVATPLFFEPGWPRRLWRGEAPQTVEQRTPLPLAALALLGVWFAVQLALPLRQRLHPGNACWHEQGYRFAWNVMVMEKTGMLELRVLDAEGREDARDVAHEGVVEDEHHHAVAAEAAAARRMNPRRAMVRWLLLLLLLLLLLSSSLSASSSRLNITVIFSTIVVIYTYYTHKILSCFVSYHSSHCWPQFSVKNAQSLPQS